MLRETFSCDDVLLVPRYSELPSRSVCETDFNKYSLPIISSPMDRVYSPELDKYLTGQGIMCCVHRYFNSFEEQLAAAYKPKSSIYRFFAVGSVSKYKKWIYGLLENGIRHFVVDMAHGDSKQCVDTVNYINSVYPEAFIIAGNVATKSGFARLEEAGAWAIRVGIGSGSICSTRLNTGFGVPLLTAVNDCSEVKDKAHLIADGGIKNPGDIMKAIAFGADMVMTGKMFAGTSLAPGACYDENGNHICEYDDIHAFICSDSVAYKEYRGMASAAARKGVLEESSVEGVSGLIPFTGTTEQMVKDLTANMKSSLGYAGATNWEEFRRRVKAIRISNSAIIESQTHVVK